MRRLLILIVLLANTLAALAQNGLKGRVVEADALRQERAHTESLKRTIFVS